MATEQELKADIEDAKEEKDFSGRVVDGKYVVRYSIRTEKNGEWDYKNYEKIFDNIDEFNSYNEIFFADE